MTTIAEFINEHDAQVARNNKKFARRLAINIVATLGVTFAVIVAIDAIDKKIPIAEED